MKKRVIGMIVCSMMLGGCSAGEYGDMVEELEMLEHGSEEELQEEVLEYCNDQRFEGDVRYYYEYNCPLCDTNNNEKPGLWNSCCFILESGGYEGKGYCTEVGYFRLERIGKTPNYYFYNESGELIREGNTHDKHK